MAAESRECRSYLGYVSLWGEDKDRAVLFIGRIWNNLECSDWMRRTGIWIRWGASQMALVDYTWCVWSFTCYWRATTKVSSSLHWWKRKALSWLSRNETWNACLPTGSLQEGIGALLKMCCFSLEKEKNQTIFSEWPLTIICNSIYGDRWFQHRSQGPLPFALPILWQRGCSGFCFLKAIIDIKNSRDSGIESETFVLAKSGILGFGIWNCILVSLPFFSLAWISSGYFESLLLPQ